MKTFKDYIYENKLFEEQCDKYLVDINSNNHEYYEIDEGVIDWFKNLFKKTGSFLEKWFKRGGKKVQASENLGSFKITEKPIKLDNISSLNAQFKNGIYSKIFVNANNYLNNYEKYLIDPKDSYNFTHNVKVHVIFFIPQYAFEGEKYPVSIIIYSNNIKLKTGQNENGIHIFNFDMSNAITGVTGSQMFKIFIENIEKTQKKLSYITYSVKDKHAISPEIKKISYSGEKFEEHADKYAMMTIINNK